MKDMKVVTIQLEPDDHEQLRARAEREGTSPADLARTYVQAGLEATNNSDAVRRRQARLDALDKLAALRARLPDQSPIDVVELIHEGRQELDERALQ